MNINDVLLVRYNSQIYRATIVGWVTYPGNFTTYRVILENAIRSEYAKVPVMVDIEEKDIVKNITDLYLDFSTMVVGMKLTVVYNFLLHSVKLKKLADNNQIVRVDFPDLFNYTDKPIPLNSIISFGWDDDNNNNAVAVTQNLFTINEADIPKDLLCGICLSEFNFPIFIHACGSTYCHECSVPCDKCPNKCKYPMSNGNKVDTQLPIKNQIAEIISTCNSCGAKVKKGNQQYHIDKQCEMKCDKCDEKNIGSGGNDALIKTTCPNVNKLVKDEDIVNTNNNNNNILTTENPCSQCSKLTINKTCTNEWLCADCCLEMLDDLRIKQRNSLF